MSKIQRARHILFAGSGRINRKEFWLIGTLLRLAIIILTYVTAISVAWLLPNPTKALLGDHITNTVGIASGAAAYLGLTAFTIWTSIAVPMKRWHDFGVTGWWNLLLMVPLAGGILWIILGITPGDKGDNKYGPQPGPKKD